MKTLLLLALLAFPLVAQDRQLSPRRNAHPAPRLAAFSGTDDAAGIAQTPWLDVLSLSDRTVPAGSTVGIFGSHLISSNANKVLIWSELGIEAVDAQATRNPFPGLEMFVFRLPENVRGEVWITVAGRRMSNTVRIIVE